MMLKNISYRKKNKLLFVATILILLIVYFQAIHKTVALYAENNFLEEQSEIAKNAPQAIRQLEKQLAQLDARLGTKKNNVTDNREYVLNKLSEYCQNYSLQLSSYPQSIFNESNEYVIESKKIEVTGNFKNITKLVYAIESELQLGRVASLQYLLKKDNATKKDMLVAKIIVQNIKYNKS